MKDIDQNNEDVDIHFVETSQNPKIWRDFRERYTIESTAVPRTLVGEVSFVGYSESDGPLEYSPVYSGFIGYRNQIVQAIAHEIGHEVQLSTSVEGSSGHFPWFIIGIPLAYLASFPILNRKLRQSQTEQFWFGGLLVVCIVSLFLSISLMPDSVIQELAQSLPFPLFVWIVALADGFNPCAFTVLIILLSLLTYTERRRDMILVGSTFIMTSAVMYLLFILGIIGVGSVLLQRYGPLFLSILGVGIFVAGLINIKDYFYFKRGLSLTLSATQQKSISLRAGRIVRALSNRSGRRLHVVAALGSTITLAIFVNLIELGCTAILPAVYMTALVNFCADGLTRTSWFCYLSWTSLYAAIYVIPLLLILSGFIYSFESSRLTEKQGRILKLIGGLFMIFFGLLMIFRPGLLFFA